MLVNGISVEVEKPRKGTKCAFCGEPIADYDFIKTSTNHQTSCFVHTECLRMRGYHETFYTPEVEFANQYDFWSMEKKAAFVAQFKMYLEHDCTVGAEGHVYSAINFHGLYEYYNHLAKWVDMSDCSCGHHMNFSWYEMKAEDVRKIRRHVNGLFGLTESWMRRNPEQVKRIFGRGFASWARDDGEYIHGSWLNLENDWNDKEARLEYRLPHFTSAKQIVWCAFMLKDWTKELRSYCSGEQDEHKTAKAILNHIQKAANGKALYQRPERNGNAKKAKSENLPFD